jgi:hypothetical protein
MDITALNPKLLNTMQSPALGRPKLNLVKQKKKLNIIAIKNPTTHKKNLHNQSHDVSTKDNP